MKALGTAPETDSVVSDRVAVAHDLELYLRTISGQRIELAVIFGYGKHGCHQADSREQQQSKHQSLFNLEQCGT